MLVEDQSGVVQTVAAYVDLNPVRAGLAHDPKDCRWRGYAEAVAGREAARQGLASFHRSAAWVAVGRGYRQVLLVTSGTAGRSGKVVVDSEAIRRELKREGTLTLGQVLRRRGLGALGELATRCATCAWTWWGEASRGDPRKPRAPCPARRQALRQAAQAAGAARRLGVTLVTTDRQILEQYPSLAVRLQEFARRAA